MCGGKIAEDAGNWMGAQERCEEIDGNAGQSWKRVRKSWKIAEETMTFGGKNKHRKDASK